MFGMIFEKINKKNYIKEEFNIIIILLLFCFINCQEFLQNITCSFLVQFSLNNGNNLICCKQGYYIFDSQLEMVLTHKNFDNEIIFEQFQYLNISQFSNEDGGNVIILTKTKFYFLKSNGSFAFQDDLNINSGDTIYSVTPYKDANDLNFILSFLNKETSFNLSYYHINTNKKKIELIIYYIPKLKNTLGGAVCYYYGVDCKIMKNNIHGNVLTCIFFDTNESKMGAASFNISNNFSIHQDLYTLQSIDRPKLFISLLSKDQARVIIGFINMKNLTVGGLTYDVNSNQFSKFTYYFSGCGVNFYNTKIAYIRQTEEFIFSCNNQAKLIMTKFDKNMKIYQNPDLIGNTILELCITERCSQCYTPYLYNIIYVPKYKNYSFIFDSICENQSSNSKISLHLLPEILNPENVYPFPLDYITNSLSPSIYKSESISTSLMSISTSIISSFSSSISTFNSTTLKDIKIYSSLFNIQSTSILYQKSYSTSSIFKSIPASNILITSHISSSLKNDQISSLIKKDESSSLVICNLDYYYLNIITNTCEKKCDSEEFINGICYINNVTENNIMNITEDIRNILENVDISKNTSLMIKGENAFYQIISSVMEQNMSKNISVIDFIECEEILKLEYGIDYILILKVDIYSSNSTNIVLKYEAYDPYTLDKLNLSLCDDVKINVYLPYILSGEDSDIYLQLNQLGYDLYNPNDSFYQDICIPFTSDDNTDVLLYERKMDYYKNVTFCEEGCVYIEYDYANRKVHCQCGVKAEIDNNIDNIKYYGNMILNNFFKLDRFSNVKILKCFKLVFSKIGQNKNFGSYIFIIIIGIFIVLMILFYINFKNEIIRIFNTIIEKKNTKSSISVPIKKKYIRSSHKKNTYIGFDQRNPIIINGNIIINNNNMLKNEKDNKKSLFKQFKKDINKKFNGPKTNNSSTEIIRINLKRKSEIITDKIYGKKYTLQQKVYEKKNTLKKSLSLGKNKDKNNTKKEINQQIYKFNNGELDSMRYEDAIEYDKRTYLQYYVSLIKQKHLIIFTFFNKDDYNLFTIKLTLLIFSFSLYFTVNALFFDDNTMNKIYKNQGHLKIYFYTLHIIYSTLISSFITLILRTLALSSKNMLKIKNIQGKKTALMESVKLIKLLYIKFNIFYIISFLLLIFFWYFISAFCAVYNNTQKILFQNTFSSFVLSLIYPFGLYLLPGLFRIPALKAKSKNKKCMYILSRLLSYI